MILEEEKQSLETKFLLEEQKKLEYANMLLIKDKELEDVYHSKSWRYTKALRKISAWALRR